MQLRAAIQKNDDLAKDKADLEASRQEQVEKLNAKEKEFMELESQIGVICFSNKNLDQLFNFKNLVVILDLQKIVHGVNKITFSKI